MSTNLLWVVLAVSVVSLLASVATFARLRSPAKSNLSEVRDEIRVGREEARTAERAFREEVVGMLTKLSDDVRSTLDVRLSELRESNEKTIGAIRTEHSESLRANVDDIVKAQQTATTYQKEQLDGMGKAFKDFGETNQKALDAFRQSLDTRVKELQESNEKKLDAMRIQSGEGLKAGNETITRGIETLSAGLQAKLDPMTAQLKMLTEGNQAALDKTRTTVDARLSELLDRNDKKLEEMRKQAADGRTASDEVMSKGMTAHGISQQQKLEAMTTQLKELTDANNSALERIRGSFDTRLKELQDGNEKKLEEMRKTVDEKLHETLEKRLGESFKQVSDRLESVHRGLGEMQTLASGVGDLKRVLTNVKARGTWAEVQLGALLEQVFTADQFSRNVAIKANSGERVEFAIRLPGPKSEPGSIVWLPIDSKFPQEDYIRLQDAADKADRDAEFAATEALARTVRTAAKDINDKYINPPGTTDFGIMFLATEGLYAEVLRQPALVDELHRKYRVVVAGPTTLVAILSSLRMGFQTLAIEQRASEVWRVLEEVKIEFGKFGQTLDKVKRQLETATKSIDQTGVRTRAIQRRLRTVEQMESAAPELDSPIIGLSALQVGDEMNGDESEEGSSENVE
ncbi:MAG: DNA recombination protein RmuC [Gemmatimonas sp.]